MRFQTGTYDFYDDNGALLKEFVPDMSDLPEFVKTASQANQADPGNDFALIMVEEDKVLKKYPTCDPGNTWLSSLYFREYNDHLPEEAQKIAAAHLVDACEAYGIDAPPEFYEMLGDDPPESNIVDVSAAELAPVQVKTAAVQKEKSNYAIERADGSQHYPLDNGQQVKAAQEYFSRNKGQFQPRERHEFAVKVASVAQEHMLPVSEDIAAYAGEDYSPHVIAHVTSRYHFLLNADQCPEVRQHLQKLANLQSQITPADFAASLEELDQIAGLDRLWDRGISDPWYSTFGGSFEKIAKGAVKETKTFQVGNEFVTEAELLGLVKGHKRVLRENFGEKFSMTFDKDPVAIFQSLPLPQKQFIARLASSKADYNHG